MNSSDSAASVSIPVVFKEVRKKHGGEIPLELRLARKAKEQRRRVARRRMQKASRRANR